jgi:putative colanic acid biosynthesis acetyltransferase WcaB
VLQDWAANTEGKSRFVLAWYRLAQACRQGRTPAPRALERVVDRAYRWFTTWFLATEIHPDVESGPGLVVYHCHAVVLNPGTRLGTGCVLRAGVCLGTVEGKADGDRVAPSLGDGVDVGVAAVIVGPLTIGDRARIGAGAVVVRDVPPGRTVVGNPARLLPER